MAKRPVVDLPAWWRSMRDADLLGALLLAISLGGVILAFTTADPRLQVFSDRGLWYLLGSAVAVVLFAFHLRRSARPLVPRGALRRTPAWGSMVVSFFIGAALIAALIDIPIFARTTIYPNSQLAAAMVLIRFLIALPVGAVVGGYLTRTLPAGIVTAIGMVLAAVAFVLMARWGLTSLRDLSANVPLLLGGFGFGLALAPVNAAVLSSTDDDVHGLTTAFVVVSRMVGMLVGISALTTIGLRRYYNEQADIPDIQRGLRRQEPLRGVRSPDQAGRHRPGADGVHRRGDLCRDRRHPRGCAVPVRPDPRPRRRRATARRWLRSGHRAT